MATEIDLERLIDGQEEHVGIQGPKRGEEQEEEFKRKERAL